MPYTPILATLIYVLSEDKSQVLLIHRNARPDDQAYGKRNGLGGKMERNEDAAACALRELREEAGIDATEMTLRGTVSWPGFGKNGEDWMAFIFVVSKYSGTPLQSNPEGSLEWTPITALVPTPTVDLWPGDRHFLPLVFDADPRPFHGVMPYEGGHPVSWYYTRL